MEQSPKITNEATVIGQTVTEEKKPIATLLGTISYENREDYENFLNGLTLEHAAIVLISAATFGQSKGIFSLDEAELVSKAIKRMTTVPEKAQTETTEESAN
jgi:hypothetical protein